MSSSVRTASPTMPGAARLASAAGRAAVAAAVLGSALAYMSDDMLNVAIPSLATDLRGTVTDIQWVVNSYYVSLIALVLLAGSLGDILGHRRVFLIGLGVFSAGALLCAVSPVLWPLAAGRAVQGIGAAATLTSGLALVLRVIHPADRTRAVGVFMASTAALPAVGPFLSGFLSDLLSWRAIFLVPLLFPAAALLLTRAFVPETVRATRRSLDLAGASVAFVGLASLTVFLIVGPAGWSAPLPLAAMACAVCAFAALVVIERRVASPMLPLRLFRNRTLMGGNLAWLLACMASSGAVFFVAISLQTTLGYRPVVAGLALMPIYLVMMVGSPLAARVADRLGPRWPTACGLTTFAAGLWMLSAIGPGSSLFGGVLPGLFLMAGGMATFGAPLMAATLGSAERSDQGVASGLNTVAGQLAGLLAIAILPAAAGLAGASVAGPEFPAGHAVAMRVATGLALGAAAIAAMTLPSRTQQSSVARSVDPARSPQRHRQTGSARPG